MARRQQELLSTWVERWLEHRAQRYPRSVHRDESQWRVWIAPALGHLAVTRIQRSHVRAFVAELDAAVVEGRISWTTARGIWTTLRVMMRAAWTSKRAELRVRDDDPCHGVELPDAGPTREATFLYPSEAVRLLGCREVPHATRRVYAVAIYLYARAGEFSALRCEDLDLPRGIVHLSRSIDRLDQSAPTKTRSNRTWVVEPAILPLLRALHHEAGGRGTLLPDWPRSRYAKELRVHLRLAGCTRPEIYTADETHRPLTGHDLRATGITWRAIRGDSLLDIQEAVGHRSSSTTEGYVRRGRALAAAFDGGVFPELPAALVEPAVARSRACYVGHEGPCHECGRPAKGAASCARCRRRHAQQSARRRKRLRKAGLCLVCSAPVATGDDGKRRRYCQRHLDYYRERDEKRRRKR